MHAHAPVRAASSFPAVFGPSVAAGRWGAAARVAAGFKQQMVVSRRCLAGETLSSGGMLQPTPTSVMVCSWQAGQPWRVGAVPCTPPLAHLVFSASNT